jgi:hypothetical protein
MTDRLEREEYELRERKRRNMDVYYAISQEIYITKTERLITKKLKIIFIGYK